MAGAFIAYLTQLVVELQQHLDPARAAARLPRRRPPRPPAGGRHHPVDVPTAARHPPRHRRGEPDPAADRAADLPRPGRPRREPGMARRADRRPRLRVAASSGVHHRARRPLPGRPRRVAQVLVLRTPDQSDRPEPRPRRDQRHPHPQRRPHHLLRRIGPRRCRRCRRIPDRRHELSDGHAVHHPGLPRRRRRRRRPDQGHRHRRVGPGHRTVVLRRLDDRKHGQSCSPSCSSWSSCSSAHRACSRSAPGG